MKLPTTRTLYVLGFVLCLSLMAAAFYFQYGMQLLPCPLCELQRAVMIGLGILFLLGALQNPSGCGNVVYGFLIVMMGIAGALIAGRQVYLQHLPPNTVESCGASLSYLLEVFPFTTALKTALLGSGECAKVDWRFLGLSMAGWTFLWFVYFAMLGFVIALRRNKKG